MTDFSGRTIPDPGFAGDGGDADPVLADALARFNAGMADRYEVHAALSAARLLVPIVAVLDEAEVTDSGLRAEKSTDMAVITLTAPNGDRALPVFTSLAALANWSPQARPVPVEASTAAQAAFAENAGVLLVDLGAQHPYSLSGAGLRALAAVRPYLPFDRDPDVLAVLKAALESTEVFVAGGFARKTDGELILSVTARETDAETLEAAAGSLAERLANDPVLRDRLDSALQVAVTTA